jgi:hypothetical protein
MGNRVAAECTIPCEIPRPGAKMAVILYLLKAENSKSRIVTIGFKRWGANLTRSHAINGFRSLEDAAMTPPLTIAIARGRIASTRRTIATCLPATDPAIRSRTVEIPELGTKTVLDWIQIIVGHLTGHVDQALDVLPSRDTLPREA